MIQYDMSYSISGHISIRANSQHEAESALKDMLRDNNVALKQVEVDIYSVTEQCVDCDE